MTKFLFSALALSFSCLALASTDICRSQHHLVRPYYPGQANSPTFDYYYAVAREARPGHTTVLVLTGGPGQTTMNAASSFLPQFPSEMGVVLLDPRGVGCNRPTKDRSFPVDFYQTESIAQDTLAVVNDLKLEHYSLTGASYGSMVATEAAGLAERGVAPKPEAVVMQGVLGHDLAGDQVYAGFQKEWAAIYAKLSPEVQTALTQNQVAGEGLSERALGLYVVDKLLFHRFSEDNEGAWQEGPGPLLEALVTGSETQQATARARANQAAALAQPDDPMVWAMYTAITCREISDDVWNTNSDISVKMHDGKLQPAPTRTCQNLNLKLDRSYNVKDWPSSAPTYYFVGSKDASTPPDQGQYHYAMQTQAERFYVDIQGGGHSALSSSLRSCQPLIWQAIEHGGAKTLSEALETCRFPTKLRHAAAGERLIPPALP